MKQVVATADAPAAIGPYSQGISVPTGRLVFCSGQVGLRPDGTMVDGDTAAQARQALANLTAVLTAAGAGLETVVRTTIYLVDLGDFGAVNTEYARWFPTDPPARATVQVSRLPRDARVEIDCIAVVQG